MPSQTSCAQTVRRLVIALAAAFVCVPVLADAAQARNPRAERLSLRPGDQALAVAAILTPSDLGNGWAAVPHVQIHDSLPSCPGVNPNFSPLTLTGQAESILYQDSTLIRSRIQVFPNHHQSAADFAIRNTATSRCNSYAITHQLRAIYPTMDIKLLSRKRRSLPRLGQRATVDTLLIQATFHRTPAQLRVDVIDILNDRDTVTLAYLGNNNPTSVQTALELAHQILTRLQDPATPSA